MIKLEKELASLEILGRNGKTVHKVPLMQYWNLSALENFKALTEKTDPAVIAEKSRAALLDVCPSLKREKLTDIEIMNIVKEIGDASELDVGE